MKCKIALALLLITFAFAAQSQSLGQRIKMHEKQKQKSASNGPQDSEKYNQLIEKTVRSNTEIGANKMELLSRKILKSQKIDYSLEQYNLKSVGWNIKENQLDLKDDNLVQASDIKNASLIQLRLKVLKKCFCPNQSAELNNKVECPCESNAKVKCPCEHLGKKDCPCKEGHDGQNSFLEVQSKEESLSQKNSQQQITRYEEV